MMSAKPLDEIEAEIIAAFRELVAPPITGQAIPLADAIPGMVRNIMVECGFFVDRQDPQSMPSSAAAGKRELADVATRAAALLKAIGAMHKPAADALGIDGPPFGDLATKLQILIETAELADIPEQPKNAGKGAGRKDLAQKIARSVAAKYWLLTDNPPTRSNDPLTGKTTGPFPDLLGRVFVSLGVAASGPAQTQALKGWGGAPWITRLRSAS